MRDSSATGPDPIANHRTHITNPFPSPLRLLSNCHNSFARSANEMMLREVPFYYLAVRTLPANPQPLSPVSYTPPCSAAALPPFFPASLPLQTLYCLTVLTANE